MCMNTLYVEKQNCTSNISTNETDELISEVGNEPISSSESSPKSHDNNPDIIEFGPIKVKQRKKPALTLATGRRSKYEVLSPDQEQKRDVRRARNRAAAERVRVSRLNVEQQLQNQIDELEYQEQKLMNNVQILQYRRLDLETRIFTHEKICPSMILSKPQDNLISAFPLHISSSVQQVEQISDIINLDDLYLESPPPLQNNDIDRLTTMTSDDVEAFIMNP